MYRAAIFFVIVACASAGYLDDYHSDPAVGYDIPKPIVVNRGTNQPPDVFFIINAVGGGGVGGGTNRPPNVFFIINGQTLALVPTGTPGHLPDILKDSGLGFKDIPYSAGYSHSSYA